MTTPDILRTKRDGCFAIRDTYWGSCLQRIDDPLANAQVDKDNVFELRPDAPKIPADLWQRFVQLCFHFCQDTRNDLEVSIRILQSETDPSVFRFIVPRQGVSGGSVNVPDFSDAADIVTGEPIESYPPEGWTPAGSAHSHNTMHLNEFSGTDDRYELGDPGLHLLVSTISIAKNNYRRNASVTTGGVRYYVDPEKVIEAGVVQGCTFHTNVLSYITTGHLATDVLSGYGQFFRDTSDCKLYDGLHRRERRGSSRDLVFFDNGDNRTPNPNVSWWEEEIITMLQELNWKMSSLLDEAHDNGADIDYKTVEDEIEMILESIHKSNNDTKASNANTATL